MFQTKENTAPAIGEKVEAASEKIITATNDKPESSKSQHIDLAAMCKNILNGGVMF